MRLFTDLEKELTQAALQSTGKKASWLDAYLQGSFRGAEYHVENISTKGGRRVSVYEFPNVDQVDFEDMGAKRREITISMYVIGSDYMQKRDSLMAALDERGPGKMVHPYQGIFDFIILDWTETENNQEGRKASFSVTGVVYKPVKLTVATADTTAEVFAKKASFLDNIMAEFEAAYNIAQMPVNVVKDALAAVDNVLEVLLAAKKVVYSVSDFQRELSNLRGKATQFILDATSLANYITGLVDFGTDQDTANSDNSQDQLRELQAVYSGLYVNPTKTADATYFAADYPATQINNLVAQTIVASSYGLLVTTDYATTTDVEETKNSTFVFLDELLLEAETPDTVVAAARDTKAAVVEYLAEEIARLSRVVEMDLVETTNILKICNIVYGEYDADKEQEILDRNAIENPAFLSNTVQVVVDA